MKTQIIACIDSSAISTAVCDTASWASYKLDAPLKFLHVHEKTNTPPIDDFSGAIGLGSREHLLKELSEVDEKRSKLAIEHAKHLLHDAKQRATEKGAKDVTTAQRHDQLLDALKAYEDDTRLFVMGRLGEDHSAELQTVGSHIESVIRAVHTPVMIAIQEFVEPSNYMLAYDGSPTADNAIERIASSPLLSDLHGHVVMVGTDSSDNQQRLNRATAILADKGYPVQSHLLDGSVVQTLTDFRQQHSIQLMVMGAYGHSRIREFFVGSNTTKMIGQSTVPLLLLR